MHWLTPQLTQPARHVRWDWGRRQAVGRTRHRRVASRSCGGWERTRLRKERKFSSMALLCASSASSARRVLVLVKGWEVVDHGGRGSVRARDGRGVVAGVSRHRRIVTREVPPPLIPLSLDSGELSHLISFRASNSTWVSDALSWSPLALSCWRWHPRKSATHRLRGSRMRRRTSPSLPTRET